MDRNAKKAILKNRVKLLSLDYFDLTAPLLASEIFTSNKHKEIKTSAGDSKARVDLLLEWLDDSAPKEAFAHFIQGIKNCDEAMLAKRIKKEAEDGISVKKPGRVPGAPKPKPKPAVPTATSIELDRLLADIVPSLPAALANRVASTASPAKVKKPKKPKTGQAGTSTAGAGGPMPLNGLPNLPPPPVPVAKKRKAEGDVKPKIKLPKVIAPVTGKSSPAPAKGAGKAKTPNKQNGAKVEVKVETGAKGTPKSTAASQAAAAAAEAAAKIMASTPRTTRKSSSSDIGRTPGAKGAKKSDGKKKQDKKGGAASASPAAKGKVAATPTMTFKEVEEKQQDFKNKFKFINSNATARSILFKDKSDITYLGCPFMANNKMCGKKVELKSKEFICEAKHKSPNCRQIPKLQVTCNDGTADLILTLMRQNVEIFTGKSETDIETMSVDEIKVVLDKANGKKLNVEVNSEKAKKQGPAKKGQLQRWNNVATIIDNNTSSSDAPPNKKKRKN